MTAFRAVFPTGNVQKGENVLVTGIGGGVALSAMQLALAVGAKVLVTSGSDEKIQKALSLGAHGGVNYKNENWTSELTKIAPSFDLIVDGSVGEGFAKLLDVASFGGRIVVYGSTQGKSPNAEPARIFWKQLSILGTTMATDEEFVAMLAFVEQHAIKPVVDSVFHFERASEALERMTKGEQFGKIVLSL
jgi:NADPH:quinone reductase-like Zn-dependent oxidoreductase